MNSERTVSGYSDICSAGHSVTVCLKNLLFCDHEGTVGLYKHQHPTIPKSMLLLWDNRWYIAKSRRRHIWLALSFAPWGRQTHSFPRLCSHPTARSEQPKSRWRERPTHSFPRAQKDLPKRSDEWMGNPVFKWFCDFCRASTVGVQWAIAAPDRRSKEQTVGGHRKALPGRPFPVPIPVPDSGPSTAPKSGRDGLISTSKSWQI